MSITSSFARNSRRALAAGAAATLLLTAAACGEEEKEDPPEEKAGPEQTVVLEAESDYGFPMTISYSGHAFSDGEESMGFESERDLASMSPWSETFELNGDKPFVTLTVEGAGCGGRALEGGACEKGAIPDEEEIEGTGTVTCRITVNDEVVAEESYTYPTIIPVTCLTSVE
ncbi:hypothetical protein [Salininema proteolyticum]|uniref:Lipoprotein n=1 Tax=Salininema proteolyticum TaxID=1607685 RepID=A0ABV8TXB7_9ACTN